MTSKLSELAEQIARIEADGSRRTEAPSPVPLQCPLIDETLPGGGLARGALHEMMGSGLNESQQGDGALMAFGTIAMTRLMLADEYERPALWCMNDRLQHVRGLLYGHIYPPGMAMMGMPVHRLLVARAPNDAETLWAIEEGLRSRAVSAVLGEFHQFEPMAARRLQLAAQSNGGTAVVLWPGKGGSPSNFAETRWRLTNLPSLTPMLDPHWKVTLERVRRSSASGEWSVQWLDGQMKGAVYRQASPQGPVPASAAGGSSLIWPQSEPEEREL